MVIVVIAAVVLVTVIIVAAIIFLFAYFIEEVTYQGFQAFLSQDFGVMQYYSLGLVPG